jgi:hypothetical protein
LGGFVQQVARACGIKKLEEQTQFGGNILMEGGLLVFRRPVRACGRISGVIMRGAT